MDLETEKVQTETSKPQKTILFWSVLGILLIVILAITLPLVLRDNNRDKCITGFESACTTDERITMCLDNQEPPIQCCEYCQEPDDELCSYVSMCQSIQVACSQMNYGYDFELNFAQCLAGGCSQSLDRCANPTERYEFCRNTQEEKRCNQWCSTLTEITYSNQPECQEQALCQDYLGEEFFSLCPAPSPPGSCGSNLATCNADNFNQYCIGNKENIMVQNDCREACSLRPEPLASTSSDCDVADTCAILEPYSDKYAVCRVNPCGADINTCSVEERKEYCKYNAPECYVYCGNQDLYQGAFGCANEPMCVELNSSYLDSFANCYSPCSVSIVYNCNPQQRYSYCQLSNYEECSAFCHRDPYSTYNQEVLCENQLMCQQIGLDSSFFQNCSKCDIETLEDCDAANIDILCFNSLTYSELCQEKCASWNEEEVPIYCTRFPEWSQYNICQTEGFNNIGCTDEMMTSYCQAEKLVNDVLVPRHNCQEECEEQRACNNNYCRTISNNFTDYCNPCTWYGLDSMECLSEPQYMADYCAIAGVACEEYCDDYDRFSRYAINVVCEHTICSTSCDGCLISLDDPTCLPDEFCYRGGQLDGSTYFNYCEKSCLDNSNLLCDDSIKVCQRLPQRSECLYTVCDAEDNSTCNIELYDSVTTSTIYQLREANTGQNLSYNIVYMTDVPIEVQLLNKDKSIGTSTEGAMTEWIIRVVDGTKGVLIPYAHPTHWLNQDGQLSFGAYNSSLETLSMSDTHQLEFVPVVGEGDGPYFMIRIPDSNVFLMGGSINEFREINNPHDMSSFVWNLEPSGHSPELDNYPSMYNPMDVLGYFRGSTWMIHGSMSESLVGDESGFYLANGQNTRWGANKHVTKRYTEDSSSMEAWSGAFITHTSLYYLVTDTEPIEVDNGEDVSTNTYYFQFRNTDKTFRVVKLDGTIRYLGGNNGSNRGYWTTEGQSWSMYLSKNVMYERGTVFNGDIVYILDAGLGTLGSCSDSNQEIFCCHEEQCLDIQGEPEDPCYPQTLNLTECPPAPDTPQMGMLGINSSIKLLGGNITHMLDSDFRLQVINTGRYYGEGDDVSPNVICQFVRDDGGMTNWLSFVDEDDALRWSIRDDIIHYDTFYLLESGERALSNCDPVLCCMLPPVLASRAVGTKIRFIPVNDQSVNANQVPLDLRDQIQVPELL